ncbi:hypothetical protein LARI1_G006688 [Lachnellula arida]|uniref:Uncharacterized protein n=1 Tax=Lachnellula arida TaxID=1316785 RepID=A0A8T9BAL1_9HELO|nr:hypothetical protein LARI1_G006688 [Lachnellula arida]
MFWKIFERLLFQTYNESSWAKVHPAQAGFRSYSMLATRVRTTAVFLDLNFDVQGRLVSVVGSESAALTLQNQIIPMANNYKYLGFPVASYGIDFPTYLASLIGAAVRWCDFLTVKSGSWGVTNRLRVYDEHLAPMFEFGAPLVESWRRTSRGNQQAFSAAFNPWKKLMAWITGGSQSECDSRPAWPNIAPKEIPETRDAIPAGVKRTRG